MHVLMLSLDDRVFDEGSEVRERMARYGGVFDSLHILVFTHRARRAEPMAANVHLYSTSASLSPFALVAALRLGSRILGRLSGPRVITSQDALSNVVGCALGYRFGVPIQVQIHTDFLAPSFRRESFKNRIRYFLYHWSVRRADCVRVVSERIRRSLESRIRNLESRISVLPVFVDTRAVTAAVSPFDLRQKYAGRRPVILMVSRLTREKNIGLAFEILRELLRRLPQALLVIAGEGPESKNLKRIMHTLKLENYIRFEGWQPDLIPYYKGADALLVTSRYEGYGRMFIEAAAAGLPIVSTDVGIIGERFQDGESALVFGNAAGGAEAIRHLVGDPELAEGLRQNARLAIRGLPDFPTYLAAYRQALESCRHAPRGA